MTYYQKVIAGMDPTCNPRHVEAWMRLEYSTISHLTKSQVRTWINIAKSCEIAEPGSGDKLAKSFGL